MFIKNINMLDFFYTIIAVLFFYHISYGAEEDDLDSSLLKGPIWTVELSDEHGPSQGQPSPGSGWEIQLPGSPLHGSALKFYPLSPDQHLSNNEIATTWDRLGDFGQAIDTTIFSSNQSRAVTAFAILGAGAGLMVSSPACGYLMYNIADFLDVPLSGAVSKFLICWISITTAPVFTTILHEKGKAAGSKIRQIFKGSGFTPIPPTGRKGDSSPHVIKKNGKHEVLELMAFYSASISAGTLTALLNVAENEYFVFFNITALPFYFLWQATYFCEILCNLNQFFQKYFYLGKGTKYKKRILQEKIAHFKLAIGHENYTKLTEETFNDIKSAREKEFPTSSGEPFVFSGLFLKPSNRADPGVSRHGSATLLNFRMDMDSLRPSWKEDMLGWFSIFALGVAAYQKFFITQHVLNDPIHSLAESFSLTEGAYIGSTILSVYETAFKIFELASSQKKFFREIPQICSVNHFNTCQWTRKIAGVLCGANACLFSLPVLVAGLDLYHDYSTLSKIAYVLPVFLIDLSFYNQLFNSSSNKCITHVLRACKGVRWERLARLGRRADVSHYADQASAFIDDADTETIEKLYNLLQEGT